MKIKKKLILVLIIGIVALSIMVFFPGMLNMFKAAQGLVDVILKMLGG